MTKKPDGGNAFPAENEANMNGTMGMSLRDYFAGQALVGLTTKNIGDPVTSKIVAGWAYEVADAMIAAREK